MHESKVRVVSFGAVDDDCLKLFVPALRFTEEIAQFVFGIDRIVSEAIDKRLGDVVLHVTGIAMAKIIVDGSPNVFACESYKVIHDERPP